MRIIVAVTLALVATAASAADGTIKVAFMACRSAAELDRAVALSRSGDQEAIKQYIMGAALSGVCTWLKVGTRVFIEHSGDYSVLKVRPEGQIDTWFTRREFVVF